MKMELMLEAAKASIGCGLGHFVDGTDPLLVRQTAIDLHGGIELLVKHRLCREHPAFLLKRIDHKEMMALHKQNASDQSRTLPAGHTIDFVLAMQLAEMLCPQPELFRRVDGLNELRNALVHSGQTLIQLPSQVLIVIDAIRFISAYVQSEFGQDPVNFFDASAWRAAATILESADPESERKYQAKVQLHRHMFAVLSEREARRRRSTSVDVDTPTVVFQCPACSEDAIAFIDVDADVDEDGVAYPNVNVTHIECPVCGLELDEDELERFEYLAETFLQNESERDSYEDFARMVNDPDS